ncbi:hypothetical protein B0H13DRAFT_1913269 [Mycena leptocephala]|nr:hypothetical protein B0H13DRAFT_1913269 [Mycena leptocephala]
MSKTPLRQRVIDDIDPAIQYGPTGWSMADTSTLNVGNSGPIFRGTSHAATSNTTLSYTFNGTAIRVFGSIIVSTDANNVTDPTWDCFVDEKRLATQHRRRSSIRGTIWCCASSPKLLLSKGRAFYVDYLVYTPPSDASFESAVLIYPNTDPSVSFGSGWRTFGGENGTNDHGAQVTLNFHVCMALCRPNSHTIRPGPLILSTVATSELYLERVGKPSSVTNYNTLLFTTPTISTSSTPTSKGSSAGLIAGGVIGAIALLGVLVALAFCYQRRRRSADDDTLAKPYPISSFWSTSPGLFGKRPPSPRRMV